MMWSRRVVLAAAVGCLIGLGTVWGQDAAPKQAAPGNKQPATLRIKVPLASATLWINDVQTTQTGTDRVFVTPPLDPNERQKYFYTIKAFWEPNNYTKITRTREIDVQAGKEVNLDMNEGDARFPDQVVVRYVPTPPEIVDEMLRMAKVGKDDVVYDLGCGDGRMVIAAVQKAAAKRGVGIDLDPQRLVECAENAKKAKVEDRVTFREGDVLKVADLSDATVVMLYMGNELNIRLRPILWEKLKPGTRIVSHRFTMGDWQPDKSETIQHGGDKYNVHLWTVTGKEGKK
jgi:uncharacterized protein (TIGR03000 family)